MLSACSEESFCLCLSTRLFVCTGTPNLSIGYLYTFALFASKFVAKSSPRELLVAKTKGICIECFRYVCLLIQLLASMSVLVC